MAAHTLSRACRIRNPVLFICDIQEKFRPAIYEFNKMCHPSRQPPSSIPVYTHLSNKDENRVNTTTKLLKTAGPLNIPVYVTTQNRAKLGNTASELQPYLSKDSPVQVQADIDKTLFSMMTPELLANFPNPRNGEKVLDIILVGIETHICVTQTTLDLLERGHRVYVIADGVSSINPEERGVALARLRDAGAIVTSSESVVFECLQDAKREGFKEVSGVVKEMKDETKESLGVFARM